MANMMNIPIDMIYPNPRNPRKHFDPEAMAELVISIHQVGILQPVVVVLDMPEEDGVPRRYRMVAGERRYRAALDTGLTELPAVVRELTPEQELEVMIIENLQRRDVNAIEEAYGMKALLDEGGYTQEALADKLGCSQGHIANRLRLLDLPDSIQENISRGIIGAGHAKELLAAKKMGPEIMEQVAKQAADNGMSVKEVAKSVATRMWNKSHSLSGDGWGSPKFDTSECQACKKKATVKEPYSEREELRCLDTECWTGKQSQAERDALEDTEGPLREKYPDAIIINDLDYGTFKYINWPQGLSESCQEKNCEHLRHGRHRNREDIQGVCLNVKEFENCHKEFIQVLEEGKELKDKQGREELTQLVAGKTGAVDGHGSDLVMITRGKLIYIASVILECCEGYSYGVEGVIEYLEGIVGRKLEEFEEGDLLGDEWPQLHKLLDELTTEQLIQIVLEWPAMALGMDRPAVEWFFKGELEPKIEEVPLTEFAAFAAGICRVCGCTDDNACEGGCYWVEPDLCSSCAEAVVQAPKSDPVHALMGRVIKTHYNTGGVVTGVSGPKDNGFYTVNYRDPSDKGKRLCTINSITVSEGMVLCEDVPLIILDNEKLEQREPEELAPRSYLDEKGQEIFVSAGLGDEYGSFRRSPSGGLHRVKSPYMPMVNSKEEAQANLDYWATDKGLQLVGGDNHCEQNREGIPCTS